MTTAEEARLNAAADRAKSAKDGEHVEFQWHDADRFLSCVRCGHIKPRTGWSKPCRGTVQIALRGETP